MIKEKEKEVYVQCPACKSAETIVLVGEGNQKYGKFLVVNGRVYHTCGVCTVIIDKK
jgi:hypothetical protein